MLSTKQEPLKEHELVTLRKWLADDGAKLFVSVLKGRVAENQIEATQKFADARQPRMAEEGQMILAKSLPYRSALEVLKEFSDINTKLYRTKVIEE